MWHKEKEFEFNYQIWLISWTLHINCLQVSQLLRTWERVLFLDMTYFLDLTLWFVMFTWYKFDLLFRIVFLGVTQNGHIALEHMCFAVFVDVALFLIKNYVIKVLKYISVYTDLHLKKRIIFIYPTGFKMQKKKKGKKVSQILIYRICQKFFLKIVISKQKQKKIIIFYIHVLISFL